MSLQRLRAIMVCEARQLRRDPMVVLRAVGVPLTLFLLFGYGLSLDVEHIPFAVVDYDQSATSRTYLYAFAGNRTFHLSRVAASERDVERLLRRGQVRLAIVIPPDFERTLYRGLPTAVQLLVDGVYPYRAEVTRGYALAVHAQVAADLFAQRLRERSGKILDLKPIEVRTRYLYNENLRTTNTIVPGLLPMILLMTPAVMTALAIVREKELGSIFNFLSSPATRFEFVLGKIVPYIVIGFGNALVLGGLALLVFGVPFKGSLWLYMVGSMLYVIASVSIGLVVSAFVRSQLGGVIVTMILTVVPSFLYSGLLIPVPNMGPAAQVVAHLFPAMFHNRIVMASFLKNLPLTTAVFDLGVLCLFIVVLLSAGILLLSKREA